MPWICNNCKLTNANITRNCSACRKPQPFPLESIDESEELALEVEIWKIEGKLMETDNIFEGMSEAEKSFAKFFSEEKILVADMDDSALRIRREELSKIAREASARLSAINETVRERKAKAKKQGFSTSLEIDDISREAINNIVKRQQKITKTEKMIEKMVEMGMDRAEAERLFSPSHIKAELGKRKEAQKETPDFANPFESPNPKPKFENPFDKNS